MNFRILGVWRLLAALLVMVFHFLSYGPPSAIAETYRFRSLMPLLDMFMIISGFLIMLRYSDRLLVERGSYGRFIARRIARFYPLYFSTLAYFMAVAVAVHLGVVHSDAPGRYDLSALPANLFLLQGWGVTSVLTYNYVGWTLSAEWFCYLTLPVPVLAQRRFGMVGLILLIVLTLLALEAATAAGIMPFASWMAADTWGAYRAFADFAIGAALAVLVRESRWNLKSQFPAWLAFGASIWLMWHGLGGYPALGLMALSIYLAALAERNKPEITRFLKPFDPAANASFSIYLIHPVIASLMLGIVWRHFLEPLDIIGFYVYWLLPMAAVVAVALLSARYYEAPTSSFLNERLARLLAPGKDMSRVTLGS